MTCSRPTLQHGHKLTSILATRIMNPWADSTAWGLGSGICKANLAAFNLTRLQLEYREGLPGLQLGQARQQVQWINILR